MVGGDVQQREFWYPWYSFLDPVLVDVQGSVNDGTSGEGNKVRTMHPDFSAVVHLHPGGPVVDDDDPLIYIGDGIQAAGLYRSAPRRLHEVLSRMSFMMIAGRRWRWLMQCKH